jgi:DNA primase
MQRATQFYRDELKRSETAIAYLKGRGLSGEIAARFGIGYAPPGWQNLAAAFPDYQAKGLVDAGLVIEGEGGKRYDRFRDRIMFPIVNTRGFVIGFGGRVLGQGEPKYLNSPETSLFEKGQELYGMFQARKALREAGRVLVVEGYMDVVALAQHGVGYAVATLGTATTPVHVQKLLRQSDNVIFCFDGDEAGRRAAWRALENSLSLAADGKNMAFLFLPQGEDPDSFIRQHGKEAFEAMLQQALPLSQFLLRELTGRVDMQIQEGRSTFLQNARPLLLQIAAPALSLLLRKRIAELAGVSQAELEELYQIRRVAKKGSAPPRSPRKAALLPVRKLLLCVLSQPGLAGGVDRALLEGRDAEEDTLLALLEFAASNPQVTHAAPILEHFRGTAREALLQQAVGEIFHLGDAFDVPGEFEGALAQLREAERNRKIDELRNKNPAEMTGEEKRQLLEAVRSKKIDVLRSRSENEPGGEA